MDDLAVWLGAQFDADERIARGADPGPWKSDSLGRHDQAAIKLGTPTSTSLIQFDGSRAAANGAHVAAHDPARVLREIDAKRRTLIRCEEAMASGMPVLVHFARQTLREMALGFSDRPGYEQAAASAG